MYKAVVIEDIPIHIWGRLHVVPMSSDKRNILDIPGGTHACDGGLLQWDIAKATSMSGKNHWSEEFASDDAGCPR